MIEEDSIAEALLAVQSALLDIVTPELRAVDVNMNSEDIKFYIRFYYDGFVSDSQIDLWDCAITEASASLSYRIDEGIEQLDYPQPIPRRGRYAYLRYEGLLIHCPMQDTIYQQGEVVNFEKWTKEAVDHITGEKIPTSWGKIYLGKDSVHLIPIMKEEMVDFKKRDVFPIAYVRLAVQHALLGVVTPELRGVIVDFFRDRNLLRIYFYYDGEVAVERLELWRYAIARAGADLGPHCVVDGTVERWDFPQKIPFPRSEACYAYLRKESEDV